MNVAYLFLIEVFITLLPSLLIISFWSKPLRQILLDLCGTEARAEFWLVYSNLMLLITPLLFVFMFGLSSKTEELDFLFLKYALGCAVFGDFFSMLVIGLQISKFIPKAALASLVESNRTQIQGATASSETFPNLVSKGVDS